MPFGSFNAPGSEANPLGEARARWNRDDREQDKYANNKDDKPFRPGIIGEGGLLIYGPQKSVPLKSLHVSSTRISFHGYFAFRGELELIVEQQAAPRDPNGVLHDPAFSYTDQLIPPNELCIRLVQVLATRGDPIRCQLATYSTTTVNDNIPTYDCLFYVWKQDGSTQGMGKTHLNGQSFLVTPNLWDFLIVARHKFPGQNLWIDAICTNQKDIQEREAQVPRMGIIYKQARRVITWLGHNLTTSMVDPSPFTLVSTQAWHCARDAVSKVYWRRAFIIQEQHMARDSLFMIGFLETSRKVLAMVLRNQASSLWRYEFGHNIPFPAHLASNVEASVPRQETWETQQEMLQLAQQLFQQTLPIQARQKNLTWNDWVQPSAYNKGDLRPLASMVNALFLVEGYSTAWSEMALTDVLTLHPQPSCENVLDRIYSMLGLAHEGANIQVVYGGDDDRFRTEAFTRILQDCHKTLCFCLSVRVLHALDLYTRRDSLLSELCDTRRSTPYFEIRLRDQSEDYYDSCRNRLLRECNCGSDAIPREWYGKQGVVFCATRQICLTGASDHLLFQLVNFELLASQLSRNRTLMWTYTDSLPRITLEQDDRDHWAVCFSSSSLIEFSRWILPDADVRNTSPAGSAQPNVVGLCRRHAIVGQISVHAQKLSVHV